MALQREHSDPCGEAGLESAVVPGDVFVVRGSGGLVEFGTAGGLLGHVMVVVGPPQRVLLHSQEGKWLKPIWPEDCMEIWKIRTAESCRGRVGLFETDTLVHICRDTHRLTFIGAIDGGEVEVSGEDMELWQSPDELRNQLSLEVVKEVLHEMKGECTNWSWTTAARALFMSASGGLDSDEEDKTQLLEEITDSWSSPPICTSVVICFWQRALWKVAEVTNAKAGDAEIEPVDLILQWMPIKADRALPGKLLRTMRKCGWKRQTAIFPGARDNEHHKTVVARHELANASAAGSVSLAICHL